MKHFLKYIITTLIVVSAIFLVGCAEINIDASISDENLVSYTYTMHFSDLDEDDPNTKALESLLLEINSHWKDNNFDSELTSEGSDTTLICKMEKQCETREEAFQVLYEFMTNEITLFDDVSYTYTKDFYKEEYSIVSHIDLTKMIDDEIYEAYPAIVGENIDDFAQNIKCTVTFSLPSNESDDDEIVQSKTTTQLSFLEPTEIDINGLINNNENIRYENSLLEAKDDNTRKAIIYGGVSLVLIVVGGLLLIFRKKIVKADMHLDETPSDTLPE
ncbi:MAG: hypothetical protein AB1Z23_09990 [Eubacteriales bacterium]